MTAAVGSAGGVGFGATDTQEVAMAPGSSAERSARNRVNTPFASADASHSDTRSSCRRRTCDLLKTLTSRSLALTCRANRDPCARVCAHLLFGKAKSRWQQVRSVVAGFVGLRLLQRFRLLRFPTPLLSPQASSPTLATSASKKMPT